MIRTRAALASIALATAVVAMPVQSEAQTWREQVCEETQSFLIDRRNYVKTRIEEARAAIQSGELSTEERRAARKLVSQLRARKKLLRVVQRRLDSDPTAKQCRRLEIMTARVASFA